MFYIQKIIKKFWVLFLDIFSFKNIYSLLLLLLLLFFFFLCVCVWGGGGGGGGV